MKFYVTMPKSQAAIFPDRCCVCGAPSPDDKAAIYSNSRLDFVGYMTRVKVAVPCCQNCGSKIRRQRVKKYAMIFAAFFVVFGGCTAIGCVFGFHYAESLGPEHAVVKGLFAGPAIFGLLAWIVFILCYVIMNPPLVELGADPKATVIAFGFIDRDYADEFSRLNKLGSYSPENEVKEKRQSKNRKDEDSSEGGTP